jgi:hypothetical protein
MTSSPRPAPRWMASGAFAIVLLYGIYSTLELIRAERLVGKATIHAVQRALELDRGNARYWLRYADLLDQSGLAAAPALQRAAEIDSLDASVWIRLGLEAEGRNDAPSAEKYLLQAAKVSRLYEPRWTLANFYFRRGAAGQFWLWARRALQLAPREPAALFQLCWSLSNDPAEIMEKALPGIGSVQRDYIEFLTAEERFTALALAVNRLENVTPADRDALLDATDAFLKHGMAEPALAAWNLLCRGGALHCEELNPALGRLVIGEDAAPEALGRGFGWHQDSIAGVVARTGGGQTAVYLSGKQPEKLVAIRRWLPVIPAKQYILHMEYRTDGVAGKTGLRWQSVNSPTLDADELIASPVWRERAVGISAPPDGRLMELGLTYSRVPGSVRIEGAIFTRRMRLELIR